MKTLLMYRDRGFEPDEAVRAAMLPYHRDEALRGRMSSHEQSLTQDLELTTLLHAMSCGDDLIWVVARKALLEAMQNNIETILYRQSIFRDCLRNSSTIAELYALSVEAQDQTRRLWWNSHYPASMLYGSIELLNTLADMLLKLRGIAESNSAKFESDGFTGLFKMLRIELSDEYLAAVRKHLVELKFRKGVLMSAGLGEWNESTGYVLRQPQTADPSWLQRLFGKKPIGYTFELAERDESGARILSGIEHLAISEVALILAQSAGHVLGFFETLRIELAFYIGCHNLYYRLSEKGEPVCFPSPVSSSGQSLGFEALYDVCLSLHLPGRAIGNSLDAGGKSLLVITGANQGGKSTFLRSIGLAQMMMQCGMFVGAEGFRAELCPALFTHYKREEDSTMKRGKFDEELARMSEIVDQISPGSLLLLNESFAATNDREGSEIARQIVSALLEKGIKVAFVTHLYEFARRFCECTRREAMFLRAERRPDGTRTFKIVEGVPLETGYGEDLYHEVFGRARPAPESIVSAGSDPAGFPDRLPVGQPGNS